MPRDAGLACVHCCFVSVTCSVFVVLQPSGVHSTPKWCAQYAQVVCSVRPSGVLSTPKSRHTAHLATRSLRASPRACPLLRRIFLVPGTSVWIPQGLWGIVFSYVPYLSLLGFLTYPVHATTRCLHHHHHHLLL